MSDLIIIGGGGHAKSVADLAQKNGFNVIGFLDDNDNSTEMLSIKRLGRVAECEKFAQNAKFVIGIGDNAVRKKIYESYKLNYITLVHPSAVISRGVAIGEGTVVLAGAIVNADAKIGKHSVINTGAIVEHDCKIGDFTMLAPRSTVCGFSKIGNMCWLGAGSTVKNVVTVGDNVVVDTGTAVVENI